MKYRIKQDGDWFYPQWRGWDGLFGGMWGWHDFENYHWLDSNPHKFASLEFAKHFLDEEIAFAALQKIEPKIHPYP